jgi:SnoaL-like domain
MDPRLQEMLDHFEITRVLGEYCHGCDRMDERLMSSVYAADSWDDHGPNKCSGPEFARKMMSHMAATTKSVSHLQGQSLININGDAAGAETYFLAVIRATGEAGREVLKQLGGRYVDELVREGGRWRIKKRVCIRDWSITLPRDHDWLEGQGFVEGERSQHDPSHAALRLKHSGPGSVA